jgi:alpha-galactosidase
MIAEELPDGRRQVQFGNATDSELTAGLYFETAKLYAVFSDHGLNGCAVAFQRHLRDHIVTFPQSAQPRPVHYNCWEAIYFDHDIPILQDIASQAKALGAERFVLDDGWFGQRDDDTSSLGDWQIDPRKYPDGLGPIVDHVIALGMQFGLWFEPEMVNPDSALYRAHPDWALGPKDQLLGRQQMVLNMALPQVGDYLFDSIGALLHDYDISYIKWDHNRNLPISDAAQTRSSYALLARLRAAFPHVEIETCASGGGRIDFGILQHTQRVWLSDSNDALERSRIQHGAALFLPSAVTGSHVGPRLCHTSGRTFDMQYRAWVAAQRHMGFEMDPRELTEIEALALKDITQWYKDNRAWMANGDILRLDSADPSVLAEMQLARDGSRFVIFSNQLDSSSQINSRPLRLTQLDPNAIFAVHLLNRDKVHPLSRGNLLLKSQELQASGAWLMAQGLNLPYAVPSSIWVIEGRKLSL